MKELIRLLPFPLGQQQWISEYDPLLILSFDSQYKTQRMNLANMQISHSREDEK